MPIILKQVTIISPKYPRSPFMKTTDKEIRKTNTTTTTKNKNKNKNKKKTKQKKANKKTLNAIGQEET